MTVYDIHAHMISTGVEQLVADEPARAEELGRLARHQGQASSDVNRKQLADIGPKLTQLDERLAVMDAAGVDVQVVSVSPSQYYDWAEAGLAERIVATANREVASLAASRPDRIWGLGIVSLQHPELAPQQLRVAIESGLRGVMISTRAGDRDLSAPALEEFWAEAERSGAAVLVHPWGCTLGERLDQWYLFNVVGQLTETTVALSHLIFGGVLDRHPSLRVCASHGGGYLPSAIGRSDHAWQVRPESHSCSDRPSSYLSKLWYDSVVHDPVALRELIDRVGMGQVLLGTDYPFDMGLERPLAALDATPGLTAVERRAITEDNFERFLELNVSAPAGGDQA